MLNDIIDGISNAIDAEYPNSSIYIDEIEQGLDPPCFLIVNLQATQEQKLDVRYFREHFFDIHYYPKDQNPTREVTAVATNLLTALEYIKVKGALVRGTGMKHKTIDGVLHFFVNYNVFVKKVKEPLPFMETLEKRAKTKSTKGD